jgi:glyoxylase-like metal-dependent hydrolase (beta-lactamase superfamily II)
MLREQVALKIGRFEVHCLSDGNFRLDGGAMFGTVPKILWCRHDIPDEKNRIPLALGCLLIKTPRGSHVLVDTGLSSKFDDQGKFSSIYQVERPRTLRDELKDLSLAPSDIDLVVNTHLHFDHAGGNTERDGAGKAVPTFSKARYLIQKEEWEDANHAHERNQASYMAENFAPLEETGRLQLVSGDYEIEPGLKILKSGGHTRGHQCVMIESEGEKAIFLGDLVPTGSHVPLPYIMGYDLYPVQTLEKKRELFTRAAEENWTLLFQHDVKRRVAKVKQIDGKFALAVAQ